MKRSRSALVGAAQLNGGKDVVGERLLDLSLVCPGAYADFRVEGVKSEGVVMRSVARRRARSPVAVRPEVVASLGRRRLPF
jgi:hypothetical protein